MQNFLKSKIGEYSVMAAGTAVFAAGAISVVLYATNAPSSVELEQSKKLEIGIETLDEAIRVHYGSITSDQNPTVDEAIQYCADTPSDDMMCETIIPMRSEFVQQSDQLGQVIARKNDTANDYRIPGLGGIIAGVALLLGSQKVIRALHWTTGRNTNQ